MQHSTLYSILVVMNVGACRACVPDDAQVLLQRPAPNLSAYMVPCFLRCHLGVRLALGLGGCSRLLSSGLTARRALG